MLREQTDDIEEGGEARSQDGGGNTAGAPDREVLHIEDDGAGPPNPTADAMGDAYAKKTRAKGAVEQIHDDVGPDHRSTGEAFSKKKKSPPNFGQEEIAGILTPRPFNVVDFDGEDLQEQGRGDEARRDALCIPTNDDMETDAAALSNWRTPADVNMPAIVGTAAAVTQDAQTIERESSVPIIPEAFLVEDDERTADDMVISGYAEPMPPWYKQKRAQQLIIVVILVVLAAAIAVGVALSQDPPETSTALAPEPTASPTSCSYRVSESMQRLDNLPVDQPGYSVIAADLGNLILVTRDIKSTESIYVLFYGWNTGGDGRWQLQNFIIEQADDTGLVFDADISGGTALVGFPWAGFAYAYTQNELGFWAKEAVSLLPSDSDGTNFGNTVSLDGDLACVSAGTDAFMFRLERDEWVQFDKIGSFGFVNECIVAGDIVAVKIHQEGLNVYTYDGASDNALISLQQRLTTENTEVERIGATSVSKDQLLYSLERFNFPRGWVSEEILAHQRQDFLGPFNLTQRLNASNFDAEFGRALDHTGDFLLVSGLNISYTFAEQNGMWEKQETVLDQAYRSYQVTGRSIVAMTSRSEFVTYDVEGCLQPMPTQTPSVSAAPSPLRSQAPSVITSPPSSSPTMSLAPTESCFWVELSIVFDPYPDELSWEILTVDGAVVSSKSGVSGSGEGVPAEERLCLVEGSYQFTVSDSGDDGICCQYGEGRYQLMSEGVVLAEGGEFESSETTSFRIPAATVPAIDATSEGTASSVDACSQYNKKQCVKATGDICAYDEVKGVCYDRLDRRRQ